MAVGSSRPEGKRVHEIFEVGIWARRGFIANRRSVPGSYGIFSDNHAQLQINGRFRSMKKNFSVQLDTLSHALRLIYESSSRVRVQTKSRIVWEVISDFNGDRILTAKYGGWRLKAIERIWTQLEEFEIVEVERCYNGSELLDGAMSLALGSSERKPPVPLISTAAHSKKVYSKNGLPVVYTHASVQNHGMKDAVKVGEASMDWGPDDARNRTFGVSGEQTSNRAQYSGPIEVLKQCLKDRLKGVYIRTNSELFVKSINVWMDEWKAKNWKRIKNAKSVLKNLDQLKEFDELHAKMNEMNGGGETVFVEYFKTIKKSKKQQKLRGEALDLADKLGGLCL